MSLVSTLEKHDAPPVGHMLLLQAAESGELTTQLDAAQMSRLEADIDAALEAERKAQETIREMCGPAPGFVPARLIVILQMGAGYTMTARDVIRALWRAKNAANRRAEASC